MYENLWTREGTERLEEINRMRLTELDDVCSFHSRCYRCPMALVCPTPDGGERILCADVASNKRIVKELRAGAHFITQAEAKEDEREA